MKEYLVEMKTICVDSVIVYAQSKAEAIKKCEDAEYAGQWEHRTIGRKKKTARLAPDL